MSADLVAAGLGRLLGVIERVADPVARAREAEQVVTLLRQFEAEFCTLRDSAVRADQEQHPRRTRQELADLTGVGVHTIVNARRVGHPISYPGRYARPRKPRGQEA